MTSAHRAQGETKEHARELDIRPQVGMYAAFSRLNYKPWFAIAEFVDNSLQSYLMHSERLKKSGARPPWVIDVRVEPDRVTVEDHAAGIAERDLPRSFSPARPPPDASGLSEFGLGLKAAACWFSKRWTVRTKALGEQHERTITFDVPEIVESGSETIRVLSRVAGREKHYTTLTLERLNAAPQKRTITKLKSHLASIYRCFLRDGVLRLSYNGEPITYSEPAILEAPYHKTPKATAVTWKKEIDIKLSAGHRVTGWAALRETASVAEAGFAVFRRGRLVLGSHEDAYRPEAIFKKPNSFTYQRLFGELHVDGFQVSHTKDGLHWEEWEEEILERLEEQLNAAPLPMLEQVEKVRYGRARNASASWGSGAVKGVAAAVAAHAPHVIDEQLAATPEVRSTAPQLPPAKLNATEKARLRFTHARNEWEVTIELANDEAMQDWFDYSMPGTRQLDGTQELTIRMNLAHPFSERFGLGREQEVDPLVRIVTAYAIAEITALRAGVSHAARTVRRNFNQLLRDALSEE